MRQPRGVRKQETSCCSDAQQFPLEKVLRRDPSDTASLTQLQHGQVGQLNDGVLEACKKMGFKSHLKNPSEP